MKCPDCTALEQRVAILELAIAGLSAQSAAGALPSVAPASDLDSQYGDPLVRKDPKRWEGATHVGLAYSRCAPDFLDCLAGFLDWCAEREAKTPGKEKYANYSRRDAARARGWAARIRSGWKPPPPKKSVMDGDDSDLDNGGAFDDGPDLDGGTPF